MSDNGGPTLTIPLLVGTPAIGGGLKADCPATDQRDFFRTDGTTTPGRMKRARWSVCQRSGFICRWQRVESLFERDLVASYL